MGAIRILSTARKGNMGIVHVVVTSRRSPLHRFRVGIGKILNLLGANLELCDHCDRYTTWDEHRLWGPFMLCPACDQALNDALAEDEAGA